MAQKYAWELQCAYKTKQHRSNNRRPQEEGMLRRGAQQCHLQWSERPATAERLLRWLALALSGWLASRPIVQTATVSSPQSYWHQPHHLSLLLLVLLQYLNLLPRESLLCILPNEVFLKTVEHCLEIFTKENVMGKSYVTEVQIKLLSSPFTSSMVSSYVDYKMLLWWMMIYFICFCFWLQSTNAQKKKINVLL